MTKAGRTLIAPLIDRSGSIQAVLSDYQGGLNAFLDEQKKVPGEAFVTLAQFDTTYDTIHIWKPITEVPHFTIEPRGATALLDAMGRFIHDIGEYLDGLPEAGKPEKVIIVVVTDGFENASTEYSYQMVRDAIKTQQDVWKWDFLFLGANMDAEQFGKGIGLTANQVGQYSNSTAQVAYGAASASVTRSRTTGVAAAFTDEEKNTIRK